MSSYVNPTLEAGKENLRTDKARVLRGGAWAFDPLFARAVFRDFFNPGDRYGYIGFRLWVARLLTDL